MIIDAFKMARLHNEEHFQFHNSFKDLTEKETVDTLGLGLLWHTYLESYNKESKTMALVRKSALTELLEVADANRDDIVHGLALHVEAAADHYIADKKQAGNNLKIVFDKYGDIGHKSYDKETADITSLYADLSKNHMAEVNLLDLGGWLDELQKCNSRFIALASERFSEEAVKTVLTMKEARLEVDESYRRIIDFVNAKITLDGEGVYAGFVMEISLRIQHFRNLVLQRRGRNLATKGSSNPIT